MSKELELARLGRLGMEDGLLRSWESLRIYGAEYDTWAVAFSGGKDSTALATVIEHGFQSGSVPRPKRIYLVQVDTRVELPPLHANAVAVGEALRSRGWSVITRSPKPMERLWVQMLGRGLPPANTRGNWWCTRSTKKAPQDRVYSMLSQRHGRVLVLYGSRIDESDARAARIAASCQSAGTECGLALYSTAEHKLAPLVGWRNCAVWDWLIYCRTVTQIDIYRLYEAYAIDDVQGRFDWSALEPDAAEEWEAMVDSDSRTGCVACHIAREDKALIRLCRTKAWQHLSPYLGLRAVIDELRGHHHRVQRSNGFAGAVQLDSRLWALEKVLAIQSQVRAGADQSGAPHWDLIPPNDEDLIRRLIASGTWPGGYAGREPNPMPLVQIERPEVLPGQMDLFGCEP